MGLFDERVFAALRDGKPKDFTNMNQRQIFTSKS
jgi:hypothetical protein